MTFTQLTQEHRYQIYTLKKMGHNQTEMTRTIGVHKTTISLEISRNKGKRGYRPRQAHRRALKRRWKVRPRIQAAVWEMIEGKLCQEWSPEQVSGLPANDRRYSQVSGTRRN